MEYSAASDAFTACPEGFSEFFNQRRRWMPSTLANIYDLLSDYKNVVDVNKDISIFYVAYQVLFDFILLKAIIYNIVVLQLRVSIFHSNLV